MEDVLNEVPCREKQINVLCDLFGEYGDPLPASLFISGNMGTGKSLCVESVLRYLRYKYVTVDCIECYSPKLMFEAILSVLEDDEIIVKSDSLMDFISGLVRYQEARSVLDPIIIILDRAERLRSMEHTIICAFLRLRELCNLNICTIFITHLILENFDFQMGARQPIKIYFPNYNKEELFRIIFLQQKSFASHVLGSRNVDNNVRAEIKKPELFANFLNAFLSVFYRPCRDLIELQHMARVNFVKYCEPIIQKEISAQDLSKLWRHISPVLKTSLDLLYLRISNSKTQRADSCSQSPISSNTDCVDSLREELTSTKVFAQSFELPYYAKYLLIAAYLASYNPPKEDKRIFMKNHGKQRKRMQQVKAKAKINEKLNTQLGPKVFTLDRLLAIFYAILEEKIGLTSNLMAQIATLVELKLVAGGRETDLDSAKYKCIVGYDFIVAVSQTVGFNIRKYLYDFI